MYCSMVFQHRPVSRICAWGFLFYACVSAHENFHNHTHLLAHAHQINNAKVTKKCVSSGRNGDVLVVKSIVLEFELNDTFSAEH